MLANELYEIFLVELEQELELLQRPFKVIHPKVFSYWLTEGEADIRIKTGILEKYTDITLIDGTSDYVLPDDFSTDVQVEFSTTKLDKKNISDILLEDTPTNPYAIYSTGGKFYLRVNVDTTASTVRVHYISGTDIQADAADYFDGDTLVNSVSLPDETIKTLKLYLLSKVIPELEGKYERKLQELINTQALRENLEIKYTDISL